MLKTHEGANMYEHTLSHSVEFFSKAGSLFIRSRRFYEGEESALSLFQKVWIVDKELSMKLLLWLRDCRGGAGNRSSARACYTWLATLDSKWIDANLENIVEVGRWDDLRSLFNTPSEEHAALLWKDAIDAGNILAAKWADRSDYPIRKIFGMKIGAFRRFLANTRKEHIVEHKMCTSRWNEVAYKKVPSVAMARYTKAFGKHDEDRFNKYKEQLSTGEATIHADVLFPHDCVRTCMYGDYEIADAQFDALPNYLEGVDERIIVIADTSGSMSTTVSGSVQAVHISQGMALYCSAKIHEDNPFHKKFIGFCSESTFKDWDGKKFSDVIPKYKGWDENSFFDGAVGGTHIDKALNLILKTAKSFKVTDDQMPTTLLIVSDMQFHSGCNSKDTEVENCLKAWDAVGYKRPKIVYWNTAGYTGSPDTVMAKNVTMVSGFSPALLTSIFAGEDMSPKSVMLKALEKYKINIPD